MHMENTYWVINAHNGMAMDKTNNLADASAKADALCELHKQSYCVMELREVYTVEPKPEPTDESKARAECERRGIDPDEICADGGVTAWMVVAKEMNG